MPGLRQPHGGLEGQRLPADLARFTGFHSGLRIPQHSLQNGPYAR